MLFRSHGTDLLSGAFAGAYRGALLDAFRRAVPVGFGAGTRAGKSDSRPTCGKIAISGPAAPPIGDLSILARLIVTAKPLGLT